MCRSSDCRRLGLKQVTAGSSARDPAAVTDGVVESHVGWVQRGHYIVKYFLGLWK